MMTVEKELKGTLHFHSYLAHPRLTADMRFGSCRASTQLRNFSYQQTIYYPFAYNVYITFSKYGKQE